MTVAEFDIAGAPLKETLAVVASNHKTVSYWERIDNVLFFYWGRPSSSANLIPLPGPMNVVECDGFIQSALTAMDYPPEPDCDGHVSKSWRVRNHHMIEASAPFYVAFVVTPHWNEYHK